MEIIIISILVIVALICMYVWAQYNGLVRLNTRVDEAWSDISIQLKYRADLIPNLTTLVKGYAAHESKVFEDVSDARSRLMGAGNNVKEAAAAEGELSNALSRLMMISESYPDLKANEGFMKLQSQLQEIEDKIQGARRFYNAGVRDLNIKIKVFPTNIFAKKLGFDARDFFELKDRETLEDAPKIEM